jgi:hypothetical protein
MGSSAVVGSLPNILSYRGAVAGGSDDSSSTELVGEGAVSMGSSMIVPGATGGDGGALLSVWNVSTKY